MKEITAALGSLRSGLKKRSAKRLKRWRRAMMDYLENFQMPFGKYKGESLLDIPVSYLEWVYYNIELNGDLEQAVSYAIDLLRSENTRRGIVKKR